MRIYIYAILLLLSFSMTLKAQDFNENFDGTIQMISNSSSGPGWTDNQDFYTSGTHSYRGQYDQGGWATLETPPINTTGNYYVSLDFDHICKLSPMDGGIIEVNTGSGWVQLRTAPSPNANCVYTGSATTFTSPFGWKFTALSYPLLWLPGQDDAIPFNSWWRHEQFNLSSIAANQPDVRIRFQSYDYVNSGMKGNYGWLLDNVSINVEYCGTSSPQIDMTGSSLNNTIYNTGPYSATIHISDNDGIDHAEVWASYSGLSGPFTNAGNLIAGPNNEYTFNLQQATDV